MMTPLGTFFRTGSNKPPKIDQHSLFTSIQVSAAVLEGDLQVYEPWRRKRNHPKQCHVTLYVNETSPFLVWHKTEKGRSSQQYGNGSNVEAPSSPTNRPRCVISVSRAKLAKMTGGSFELTDFTSNLTFRFIAQTIREADAWVEKLAEESLREANLDMRSICSSSSSFTSSTSSFPSPDAGPNDLISRFAPVTISESSAPNKHKKSASFSDTNGAIIHLLNSDSSDKQPSTPTNEQNEVFFDTDENNDVFAVKSTPAHIAACKLGHTRSTSKTLPRTQSSKTAALKQQQQHIRAQPHLGLNKVLDKHRPELRNMVPDIPRENRVESAGRSELPFSEYFVHVPDT